MIDEYGNIRSEEHGFMNGPDVFNFLIREVPKDIKNLLAVAGTEINDFDFLVFHQANKYMLDFLRKKLAIPTTKFVMAMENCGNTVSSSIPIALFEARQRGTLQSGMTVMLVGFGVGLSWGACLVKW